ncbi:MAG TPA: recombination-associated protein RdgC [Ramlibacter sp.]|jgi:recombination associated protein RdgC|uniref:recombination-associated protein RdgC n=1 Tax=Ramlibacter sp. TaxID=1917967 RepID=UPI002D511101|nr:recombination-associated protein RdgC [Ramlibacter sp.]HZY18764.1 recombination-associated protein RdgC [Ramlibacter sp.]
MPLFKNIVVYRIGPEWTPPAFDRLDAELQRLAFVPCQPTQEHSAGWVPPRGKEHGALVEIVGGQWILKLMVERKAVPGGAVRAELEERCRKIEQERGRKPGRKEKNEIKEEIVHSFLPRAFSKRGSHSLWIDLENRALVVSAGSLKAAEPVLKPLVDLMAELGHVMPLAPLNTATSPATAMGEWLTTREAPAGFTIDRDLELKKPGEEKSVVRYARHSLELDEIGQHIQEGKLPTQLAMTWNDKVSFVLTEHLGIRKIDIRDVDDAPKGEDGFDADVAIATGELSALLPDLLASLGGELAHGEAPTLAPAPAPAPAEVAVAA